MKKRNLMIVYTVAATVSGIALSIWRTLILYRHYDPYNSEFSSDADRQLIILSYVALAVILLMLTSYFFLKREQFEIFSASSNQVSIFSSSLCGFIFAAAGILIAIYFGKNIFRPERQGWFFHLMILIAFFSLFAAAAYFIFSASVEHSRPGIKKALSFFPTLWALSYLSASYINADYLFNDPNRILCNVSLCALLIFFLFETKNTVSTPQNPARFAFSLVALICVLLYMLPTFVLTAFWEIPLTYTTLFEVIECGAVFYIFATLYTMILSLKTNADAKTNPIAESKKTDSMS